jgi:hypothetical protein
MPTQKRKAAKRQPALRPDRLSQEARTLRQTAIRAIDPGTQQDFEDMAERRERLARAIEELEATPTAPVEKKPKKSD